MKPTLFEHVKGFLLLALEWASFGLLTFVGWKIGSLIYQVTLSRFSPFIQLVALAALIISLIWFNKKYKK